MPFDWYRDLVRPALFQLDPETAHGLAVKLLSMVPGAEPPEVRPVTLAGLTFPNPIGLAAGFDKGGEAVAGAFRLGFGHVEVGTITPKPQSGNPRPRMFRLAEYEAVINRFGFNSEGHDRVCERLSLLRRAKGGVLGINIGANKDSDDQAGDYVAGVEAFSALADYLTVNISSPNTPGLRDFQGRKRLATLLDRVLETREARFAVDHKSTPIFLKVAPDLTEADFDDISFVLEGRGVNALIVSNTSVDRSFVAGHGLAQEAGGLSGRPVFEASNVALAAFHERLGEAMPLIGVGGIAGPEDMSAKFDRGATLVQLYTSLVYQGPSLIRSLLRHLETV